MAARRCPHTTGETIFHSDRGCQYTSAQLARHLKGYGTRPSVSRTRVCWAESFNATLKNERVYQMVYPTRVKAIRDVASRIELEHTIRDSSTPPWGTGRRARSTRSTEQQDKQPERPLSELSETRSAAQSSWSAPVMGTATMLLTLVSSCRQRVLGLVCV